MASTTPRRSRKSEPEHSDLAAENAPLRKSLAAERRERAELLIENGRLRGELAARDAQLEERLAEQTATSDILRVIAASPTDLARSLDTIAERAARLTGSTGATVLRVANDGFLDRVGVWDDPSQPERLLALSYREPVRNMGPSGRAVLERRTTQVPDVRRAAEEQGFDAGWAGRVASLGFLSFLTTPLINGPDVTGVLVVRRNYAGTYAPREVALLETFAAQAAIAVENARLFSELQESNGTLKQALEQQTATAEVLRVIASSPTQLGTVLGVITERAARLCGADNATMRLVEGDVVRVVAHHPPALVGHLRVGSTPLALGATMPIGRAGTYHAEAFATGRTVYVPDLTVEASSGDEFRSRNAAGLVGSGICSIANVPLLREGQPVGILHVRSSRPHAFDSYLPVLQTFADQAVIAIENSRLFGELQERDDRRRQELERASAIQQRLLPASVEGWPGVLEIAVRFRPAVETSGDFYDVLPLPVARKGELEPLQIAVGDVAGKGMSAALVTALARSALQLSATVPTGMATPATTLRIAGQRLHRDVGVGHFVACALAVVEPPNLLHDGPRLTLANAAQVPVLLVRAGQAREIEPTGDRLPLGARPDGDYQDIKVDLCPGDVVVFSSDGLVEAPALPTAVAAEHLPRRESAGELFGFDRLATAASHWSSHAFTAEEVAAGVWSDLIAWCGDESHHDDMTLLVLRVPPPEARE